MIKYTLKKGQNVFIPQYNEFQTVDHDVIGDTRFTTNNSKHSYSTIYVIDFNKLK